MSQMQRPAGAPLRHHGRYAYSPLGRRSVFRWPNGARVAVYFALGLEEYSMGEGLAENLVPGGAHPDVLNTSWRDYGNRVGAWRVLETFRTQGWPLAILLNSAVCESAPELVDACRSQECEFIAHGYSNSDTLAGLSESQESDYVRRVAHQIAKATSTPPAGWSSPWIAETAHTPDILQECGYGYLLDWCMDEQPVWLKTRSGRILSVPYSQELNDSSAVIGRQVSATEFCDMIVDQFDELCGAQDGQPVVMSVILHSFITGQPFRLRALRRALAHIQASREPLWITQPGAIASAFRQLEGR
jgi:peptidoglycan/xylan/chitin deacetylase (PgdA/CDA1 family)